MSEKTLKHVSDEAKWNHGRYVDALSAHLHARDALSKDYLGTPSQRQAEFDRTKNNHEGALETNKNFVKENASRLHELAVLEAHIGGVAINVEQPIVVGQKVEVRTPDQQ